MGRHHYDAGATRAARTIESSDLDDWEEAPPTAPLWRVRIVTSAVLLLAVVAGTWWVVGWLTSPAGPTGSGAPSAAPVGPAASAGSTGGPVPEERAPEERGPEERVPGGDPTGPADTVTVHVAGEVTEPGLVELPAGARVQDALLAAGGPTEEAAVDLLNLAAPAVDGSQIVVPGPDGVPGVGSGRGGAVTDTGSVAGAAGTGVGGTGMGGPGGVNLNTADSATLEQLPGIGPALAGRIIDHREQVGPFGSLEDLDAVSGIGPAMMERLDGLVSW